MLSEGYASTLVRHEVQSGHDLSESDCRVFPSSKWVGLIQMRSWHSGLSASTNTTADDEQGSRADANSPGWGWSRRACWDGLGMVVGVRRREYRSCRSRTMGGRDVQYLLESRMDLKVRRKAIMTNEVERPMYRPPIYRPTAGNEALNPECQSRIYFGV